MRILIAGGAGFVGANLSRALLARGDEVFVVDNLSSGLRANIPDEAQFQLLDIADASAMWSRRYVEKVDVVVHLASLASPVDYSRNQLATLSANSAGTIHLLQLAEAHDARFIYASTSEVYGDPLVHPQPETYNGNVSPIGPRSCYDEGKRFGEALVTAWRRERGIHAAIVRIFNTYGPFMRLDDGRVVSSFIRDALTHDALTVQGSGQQTRSFMYVSDLVDALKLLIDAEMIDSLVLNVGNPVETTVTELAVLVCGVVGRRYLADQLEGRPDDPQRRCPDITQMRARFGWEPKVSLRDGLQRTVAWARTQIEVPA